MVESFESHGVRCAASVYRPTTTVERAPVIVMAHGFGGIRRLRLPAYAERFAAAGYVVVTFDYRGFGDSAGDPRQVLRIGDQLDDWRAAIAWARALDGVDADRVIGWGTSFSGGHVLTLAKQDAPFTAVVSQVPHVSGPEAVRANGIRQAIRLAPVTIADVVSVVLRRPPRYVSFVGRPGSTAVMTAPGSESGIDTMIAASGLTRADYPETVAARILLRIGTYSPRRRAAAIDTPVLLQIARDDAVAPAAPVRAMARRMPSATVREYDGGHFDPYVDPMFETVIADQLEFLRGVVPAE